MAITPAYTASGIASGIDTNAIVNQLVAIESQPITTLQKSQSALKSQVSQLGSLASRLSALNDAAKALSTGVVQVGITSTNTGFSTAADATASEGSYGIQVTALAKTAKARSQGYASATTAVDGGTLHLDVRGTGYDVVVKDGTSLQALATQLNASGAPVIAAVVSDGTQSYLSITNRDSGVPAGTLPADALKFTFTSAGTSTDAAVSLANVQTAGNAAFTLDGLPITSESNDVSTAIPGVTLSLKALTAAPETLVLGADQAATAKNLQAFVTAYNNAVGYVQSELGVSAGSDRSSSLAGDSTVRTLQQKLQSLLTTTVAGSASVRSLADLGLTTQQDGTVALDTKKLNASLALDPGAVNNVFAQAGTGLSATTQTLVTQFTDPINGALTLRQQGLDGQSKQIDSQVLVLQNRVDSFRANLVAQFTAMEAIVSAFKATSSYLTSLSNQLAGSNK